MVIFPEGTRVAPGEQRRYAPGGAILAEHSGYPLVPIAHNAGEFWPKRGFLKRPGVIRVVIGPPLTTEGRNATALNQAAEIWIEGVVQRISTRPSQIRAMQETLPLGSDPT